MLTNEIIHRGNIMLQKILICKNRLIVINKPPLRNKELLICNYELLIHNNQSKTFINRLNICNNE